MSLITPSLWTPTRLRLALHRHKVLRILPVSCQSKKLQVNEVREIRLVRGRDRALARNGYFTLRSYNISTLNYAKTLPCLWDDDDFWRDRYTLEEQFYRMSISDGWNKKYVVLSEGLPLRPSGYGKYEDWTDEQNPVIINSAY